MHAHEPGWVPGGGVEVVDKNGNPPEHWNQRFYDKKTGRIVQKGLTQVVKMWPTASSRDWKDTPGMATEGTNPDGSKRKRLDQLPRAVYHEERKDKPMFPTPIDPTKGGGTSRSGKRKNEVPSLQGMARHNRWPTPTSSDANGPQHNKNKQGGKAFREQVNEMWPTPSAQNQAGGTTGLNGGSGARKKVEKIVGREEGLKITGGKLNPDWVEWLMGWPLGSSDVDPLERVTLLAWDEDPSYELGIPRVTDRKENRRDRLKVLGNGQVPACAVAAWNLLTQDEEEQE